MKPLNIFGLIVFLIGSLILIGYGLYEFTLATDIPPVVKWGAAILALGTVIILISLVLERVKEKGKEE
ncbi:MAG: hypothetical protein KAS39_07060 [Actinomycetia bacterium]|nr:hypothetical protein [Actinomycetes bacterium]